MKMVMTSSFSSPSPGDEPETAQLTRSEHAYRILRRSILTTQIAPGEKLKIESLQRKHTLSSSPLREALNRLSAEGLVQADDHRGFRAAAISVSDLNDITNFRLVLECAALRQSIEHGDHDWEGEIVASLHRLERTEGSAQDASIVISEQWTERHKQFHVALIAGCPSQRLISACAAQFDQTERYRRLSLRSRTVRRDTRGEHRALMEATLARDAEKAAGLLHIHISETAKNVARVLGF